MKLLLRTRNIEAFFDETIVNTKNIEAKSEDSPDIGGNPSTFFFITVETSNFSLVHTLTDLARCGQLFR